jgi:hypothetical protein
MVTPLKGDFASIPVNAEARKVGAAWDPAKDEAAGQQCKAYGAPAIMRVPGRMHITWQDDDTLKVETDAGTQTRLFHFAPAGGPPPRAPQGVEPAWQGYSVANWERPPLGAEIPDPVPIFSVREGLRGRSLEVLTSNLRPGYLRKNGVPAQISRKNQTEASLIRRDARRGRKDQHAETSVETNVGGGVEHPGLWAG